MHTKLLLTFITSLLFCNSLVANFPIKWDFGNLDDPPNSGFTKANLANNNVVLHDIEMEWTDLNSDYITIEQTTNSNTELYFESTTGSDLVSLDSNDVELIRDYIKVRNITNPAKIKLSGFNNYTNTEFKIQWITTFQRAANFTIHVTSTNATNGTNTPLVETITNTVSNLSSNIYDVRYSEVYTVSSGASDVEFTFNGGSTGNYQERFGISGVVITASPIPELNNYSLILGCFGLTWMMVRRRRYRAPLCL